MNLPDAKLPPQALDVEAAVLGALMLDADAIHIAEGIVNSRSFYLQSHGEVYDAIQKLSRKNHPIDLLTVTKALKDENKLDEVGGPLFVTGLVNRVASAAHLEYHCRIIAQLAIQRELIKIGSELGSSAYEEGVDIEDLLSDFKSKIFNIENIAATGNDGKLQRAVLDETIKEIENDCIKSQKGLPTGIPTGFSLLDAFIGGWKATNLIVLASRPGVGKTSLALHFAKIAAKTGYWVNYWGLEMTSPDLQRIIISGESNVNRTNIRDGKITDQDWKMINAAIRPLENLPIIWYDCPVSVEQIRTKTIKNKRLGRCQLIILDYLQLIIPSDKKVIREQQVANITRVLKQLALSEGIPIILLSQLNREASNEIPRLSFLRESGAIEQDADIVIFPYRREQEYSLIIGKNRRGKIGKMEIWVNDQMTVFGDRAPPS